MKKGHTSYKCYIRRFDVPRGKYVSIPKELTMETNHTGPNLNWYLSSLIDFVSYVCLKAKHSLWYLDSGCSRHKTSDKSKLTDLVLKKGGYVTYRGNNKGRIMGEESIRNQHKTQIKNVLYVDELKHNILSIS